MGATQWHPQPLYQSTAEQAVDEAKHTLGQLKHYTLVARQLPLLLRRHGVGQTLTYLHMRGGGRSTSHFELLAQQLDRCLAEMLGTKQQQALAALTQRDSRCYREATEQIQLFLRALASCLEELK